MSIKYKVLFILRGFCSFPTWSENLAPWYRRLSCVRVPLHKKTVESLKNYFPKNSVASLKSNLPALAGRLQCILPLHLIWTWARFEVGRNYRNFISDMGYKRLPVCRRCVSNHDGPEKAPEKSQASLKIENPFPTRKLDDQSAENIVFLCCYHLKHMFVNRTNNITENRCSNTSRAWIERCQGKPQRTQYLRVSIWKYCFILNPHLYGKDIVTSWFIWKMCWFQPFLRWSPCRYNYIQGWGDGSRFFNSEYV